MAAVLIQGKPPLVLSSVPQGVEAELSPVEEGPCGLPVCVAGGLEGLCWRWGCSGRAQPRGITPCPPGPAGHWLHSPSPRHAKASWTAASGTGDRTTAPQPCAQGSWGMEQSLGTVGAAPSRGSPGHCPGCADAPGGLRASPISAHPEEPAWHSLCRRRWGVSSRWGMSHRVSTSGLGSHL